MFTGKSTETWFISGSEANEANEANEASAKSVPARVHLAVDGSEHGDGSTLQTVDTPASGSVRL